MATDSLDPGVDGDYPYMPRNADGTLDVDRMPVGLRRQVPHDRMPGARWDDTVLIDVAPGQVRDLIVSGVLTLPAGVQLAP